MSELPEGRWNIIYADPAWPYNSKSPTTAKRPSAMGISLTPDYYYPTMPLEEIKALPVARISEPDSVCFLWATNPLIREALEVLEVWGFKYTTMVTWHKTNSKGMGYWFRGFTEHLLFGKKGNVKSFHAQIPNIQAHKFIRHSQKPDLFRKLIEKATASMPNPRRIELFARERHEGWDVWGNQLPQEVQMEIFPLEPRGRDLGA
jgi:site-specific DNA-methyltransferase (adenine-specific)